MKNPLKKAAAVAAVVACTVLGGAGAAQATYGWDQPATPAGNHESTWGENCHKIEFGDGVKTYTLESGYYSVVVVKAGRTNTVYEGFWGGDVSSLSGKDISHIIYCPSPYGS
ncbi:hypothetical protein ACFUTX_02850 [Microbacterium sp. NPDC057407]|uniref:hypothetical protein n=1 Tax=Microbacterium sp. NPDC057407 TaxID=3346120 RepID=UPI003672478A